MPTTAQILELEDVNVNQIMLHSEGMFWKAYQQSAFLLLTIKSGLKVKKKFIKAVGRDVVSVGFPKASLEKYFSKEQIKEQSDKSVIIASTEIETQGYKAWFDAVEIKLAPEPKAKAVGVNTEQTAESALEPTAPEQRAEPKVAGSCEGEILQKVREFRIDSSSPLECMMFIGTIQRQLDGHL